MHIEGNEGLFAVGAVTEELHAKGEHVLAEVSYEQEGADEGVVYNVFREPLHSGRRDFHLLTYVKKHFETPVLIFLVNFFPRLPCLRDGHGGLCCSEHFSTCLTTLFFTRYYLDMVLIRAVYAMLST